MKIIYFTRPYSDYKGANYQSDVINFLCKKFEVTVKVLEPSYETPNGELITKKISK